MGWIGTRHCAEGALKYVNENVPLKNYPSFIVNKRNKDNEIGSISIRSESIADVILWLYKDANLYLRRKKEIADKIVRYRQNRKEYHNHLLYELKNKTPA